MGGGETFRRSIKAYRVEFDRIVDGQMEGVMCRRCFDPMMKSAIH